MHHLATRLGGHLCFHDGKKVERIGKYSCGKEVHLRKSTSSEKVSHGILIF